MPDFRDGIDKARDAANEQFKAGTMTVEGHARKMEALEVERAERNYEFLRDCDDSPVHEDGEDDEASD
jgi:hypothetical protein